MQMTTIVTYPPYAERSGESSTWTASEIEELVATQRARIVHAQLATKEECSSFTEVRVDTNGGWLPDRCIGCLV